MEKRGLLTTTSPQRTDALMLRCTGPVYPVSVVRFFFYRTRYRAAVPASPFSLNLQELCLLRR
jgi:hypothetical protein